MKSYKSKRLHLSFSEAEVKELRYAISKAPSGGAHHSDSYNKLMRELKTTLGIDWHSSEMLSKWGF